MLQDHLYKDFPYLNNVTVDPRLVGLQAGMLPFLTFTTAPRIDMFASHINQALVIDGSEFPMVFAGTEQNLGEFPVGKTSRDQDVHVVKAIPKYPAVVGSMHIRRNPSVTLIYIGAADNKLHYMTVETYTQCSDGFGYENRLENTHLWHGVSEDRPGFIPKEARLVASPNHKNGLYCMGLNLNVAFMTLEETIEDAVLISQSAADRMSTTEIHQVRVPIRADQYPLNSYGDEIEPKMMPDIGEVVNQDGVLLALRPTDLDTFIPDTMASALGTPQTLHDTIYRAPPGAYILDITVNAARGARMPRPQSAQVDLYAQVDKYLHASNRYWQEILSVYNRFKGTHECSPEFNELVTTAIRRLAASPIPVNAPLPGVPRRGKTRLIGKGGRPIDFMEIIITYSTKRACAEGFKLTGRDGQKGVICRIWPDADMPVDDHGFRADIVIDPASAVARMTMGPLYEQAINRVSEFVRRRIAALYPTDPKVAVEMLLDYYTDINPNNARAVRAVYATETAMASHIEDCIRSGIHHWVPPGLDTIGMPLIKKLKTKWEVPISPVTFTQRDMDGNLIGTFRTRTPVAIGKKYIYLLCKIPEPSSPCIGYVNQYKTPMKPPASDKALYPIRRSPTRFGEDEGRIIGMDLHDIEEYVRLMCLQSTSLKGANTLADMLLTSDHPTRIPRVPMSNAELMHSSTIFQVFHHEMATMGIGSTTAGPVPILGDLLQDKNPS